MPRLEPRAQLTLFFTFGLILGKIGIWGGIGILLAMIVILFIDRD